MVDVLLGHSNFARLDPKQLEAGRPYLPLGTLYAASSIRARGFEVAVFDATLASGPAEFSEMLRRTRPRAVVLYEDSFNWLSKMCLERMRDAALAMLGACRDAGVPALAHGSDAADHPGDYLASGAREVALGEGELTAAEWVERSLGEVAGLVREVSGLTWIEGGELAQSTSRPLLQQLDELPWPARDLVDVERYRRAWISRHGRFTTNLVTTRGCPYLCNWCSKPVYGNTYHSRSPEDVAREMGFLKRDLGADGAWFADDILGLKPAWTSRFAHAVEREGSRLPFQCQTRIDLMTEGTVADLARAGCSEVWMGVESGAQSVLDSMDKGISIDQVEPAVRRLKARGIRVAFFLQFGYPGEDWPEIQRTRRLVVRVLPDDVGISVSYPQPGTGFHEAVSARLQDKLRWETSGDSDPLFTGLFRRPFYQTLHRVVHAELKLAHARRAAAVIRADVATLDRNKLKALAVGLRAAPVFALERAKLEWQRRTERAGTPGKAPPRKLKRSAVRRVSG